MGFKKYALVLMWIFCLQNSIEAIELYRLPQLVIPVHYDLRIELNEDAFGTNKFKGQVNITLNVSNTISEIQLHSKGLQIEDIELLPLSVNYNNLTLNNSQNNDILSIQINQNLSPDFYYLVVAFNGNFSLYDMHGLYKSSYKNVRDEIEYLAITQFEVTHARRSFPCFDEPAFKATFNISIKYPKGYNVIANTLQEDDKTETGNNTEMVKFKKTPKMSTYLIAFVISKFTCDENNTVPQYKICSRPEASNARKYALEITPKLLKYMENFTGILYNSTGMEKIDQVVIPDFSPNAMENWGLITYKETALLWYKNESSNVYKQRVASIIAHELTHMWFGNLVTLKWWSDVFLNEGFARYFQYFATAEIEKEWQLDKQFVIEQVQSALAADSSNQSLPLSSLVNNSTEISDKFDIISYNKGASIIRMISHIMGLESFQRGIQQYLETHKLNNTVPEDLWNSLMANFPQLLPYDFKIIINNWTLHAGYPLLNVQKNGTKISITQERFLLSGKSDAKWYVPITYTTSNGNKTFNHTLTQEWLTPNQTELILDANLTSDSDWIVLNNQQIGFYRVNYDENLWNNIYQTLNKDPNNIHVLNRAQIVDDLFNLAKADKISYSKVLNITSFLKKENEYYPWYAAFNGFSHLLQRINNKDVREKLSNHIKTLMKKLNDSVEFTPKINEPEDHIYTLKQIITLSWACQLGCKDCINNSKQMFAAYKNGTSLNRNLRPVIYCTALKHNTANVEQDWNFLWNKFTTTKIATEQVTILSALGCTTNATILKRYLSYAINASSAIRRHDSSFVFSSVYDSSPENVNVAAQFLIDNYTEIVNYYKDNKTVGFLISSLIHMFTEQSQIDNFARFIEDGKLDGKIKDIAESALGSARKNLDSTKTLENALTEYFKEPDNNNSAINIKPGILILLTSILIIFYPMV